MDVDQSRPHRLTFLWHSVTPWQHDFPRAPPNPCAYLRRMTDETDLDVRGLLCPLPVLKARKRLLSMDAGERLTVDVDRAVHDVVSGSVRNVGNHFCLPWHKAFDFAAEQFGVEGKGFTAVAVES